MHYRTDMIREGTSGISTGRIIPASIEVRLEPLPQGAELWVQGFRA